ncbi:hypothetical protein Daus18300_012205 [Diaporthe australafricana]|uniref:Ketoreductase (KR) domain-containing protein n=1 Tax=Diaporthe australafricana TaxID=127596 RepID=A0ABR3W3U4_9PEZI
MAGTILITGANGSLAIHVVRHLLKNAPDHTLLLTVRDTSDGDQNTCALRDVVAKRSQQTQVSIRQLNHSHLASVHKFSQDVSKEIADGDLPLLVSIVCNAYYWNLSRPLEKTDDGFEKTIQVAHLAHVALVLRLLSSFHPQQAGRIVQFSTDAIFPGKNGLEKIPPAIPADMELLAHPPPDPKNDTWAHGFQRYANAKLAAVMWIHALNRRLEKARQNLTPWIFFGLSVDLFVLQDPNFKHITAVAVHPGSLSDSRALRTNTPFTVQLLSKLIVQPLRPPLRLVDPSVRTSSDAGTDVARLAINEASPNERGHFVLLEKLESSPDSLDEEEQEAMWRKSAEWVGLMPQDIPLA